MTSADCQVTRGGLVRVEQLSGVHRMILSRPAKRNAISKDMYDEAAAQVSLLAGAGVRVAVLAAAGPVFCTGGRSW